MKEFFEGLGGHDAGVAPPGAVRRRASERDRGASFGRFAEEADRRASKRERDERRSATKSRFLKTLLEQPAADRRGCAFGPLPRRARWRAAVGPPRDGLVVELGPGTGPVTKALIEHGVRAERWCWSNTTRPSAACWRSAFRECARHSGRRLRPARTLAGLAGQPIAAVVSSLPLLNQPPPRRTTLIADAFALMGPAGCSCSSPMASGSPIPRRPCGRSSIRRIARAPIWLNLPPALVWTYRADDTRPTSRRDCAFARMSRIAVHISRKRWRRALHGDRSAARKTDRRARHARRRRRRERLVERIGDSAVFYKVGMELAYGGGLPLVTELAAAGKQVFLDLKLHDIPNTVERATAQAARLGATFLTVHAYPQTMRAAVAGAPGSGLQAPRRLGADLLATTPISSRPVTRFGVARAGRAARRAGAGARHRRTRGERRRRRRWLASPARRRSHPGHARHSARGRRRRRPEARRHAGAGDRATAPTISSSAARSPRRRDPRGGGRGDRRGNRRGAT